MFALSWALTCDILAQVRRIYFIASLAAILVAAGCATTSGGGDQSNADGSEVRPREIAARVARSGLNPGDAKRASSLYALKCGKCHKFYDPGAYNEAEWNRWLDKMGRKSKATETEQKLLSEYLNAARNSK